MTVFRSHFQYGLRQVSVENHYYERKIKNQDKVYKTTERSHINQVQLTIWSQLKREDTIMRP